MNLNLNMLMKRIQVDFVKWLVAVLLLCFISMEMYALECEGTYKIGNLYYMLYDDMTAKVRDNQYGG